MFLTAFLATLVAGALTATPTTLKPSTPNNLPSVKASIAKAATSMKPATSSSTPKIHDVTSVSPKSALSTVSNEKSAPHLKSRDSTLVTQARPVPVVARMISIKNTKITTREKKSFASINQESSTITTNDPVKIPSYDYIEPEEISNKLEGKFVDTNKKLVNLSFVTTHQEKAVTTTEKAETKKLQNATLVPVNIDDVNTEDSFIDNLKENLRRGNDDYLDKLSGRNKPNRSNSPDIFDKLGDTDKPDKLSDPDSPDKLNDPDSKDLLSDPENPDKLSDPDSPDKLSGRRRGNNIQISRPKHIDIRLRNYEKAKKDRDRARRTRYTTLSTRTRSKLPKTSMNPNRIVWQERNHHSTKFVSYVAGLTTPSKYEIKPYRKPRKNERRHQGDKRPFKKPPKYRMHENDFQDRHQSRGSLYHVQRRQDDLETVGPSALKSVEITMPADLASDLMLQRDFSLVTSNRESRPHLHLTQPTKPSVATRPTVYDTPASSKGRHKPLNMKHSTDKETLSTEEKPVARSGDSLTTGSAFEKDSLRKQKKLERFVKFINKNRNLLQQFIKEKKASKIAERNAFFRGGVKAPVKIPAQADQLDLSPGKGGRIEAMRARGRICQRNVMIPEGPKYNSLGQTYMPAYKRRKNDPDYPATKPPLFLIPICCNCCKKSVLGCQ